MKKYISLIILGSLFFLNFDNVAFADKPTLKFGDPMPIDMFIELAKLVNPSVVNISTTQKIRARPRQGFQQNDPFFDFFEQFMGPGMDAAPVPAQSLGTGFVIESDGLIVTNNHVVAGADQIKVQFIGDKRLYDAQLVGRDERGDIALIRVKAGRTLPTVQLGTSESVQVGEWVAAFGNPFGHSHSMSKGIISAKGRNIEEINAFPFLQTDASINPGNSGGPLVNTHGEVIGVNAAIDARAQGIGFAIPIDSVKNILPQLKTKGKVTRGFLGVNLADIDIRSARQLGLKSAEGALIVNVVGGSPADKAGIKTYDVITKFGDHEVKSARDLSNAVLDQPIGKAAALEVMRNGKKVSLSATPTENAPGASAKKVNRDETPEKTEGENSPHNLGFKVAKLTPKLSETFKLPNQKGEPPVVVEVEPGTPADRGGLHVGDIVLDVNRERVASASEVLKSIKSGVNVLRVQRGNLVSLVFMETE